MSRIVQLITGTQQNPVFVPATLVRDFPPEQLPDLEAAWASARGELGDAEHAHWDWRNKMGTARSGHHRVVAVECDDQAQGLMALLKRPRRSRVEPTGGTVLYVDYLEVAPWNLRSTERPARYFGLGTVLVVEAVLLSLEAGLGGRVGLHSLPQAAPFYRDKCRMTDCGSDPDYYDLLYFEYSETGASDLLARTGVNL